MSKINHHTPAALRPRSAVLQFSTALAWTSFFLSALSPREFRRATEAGSFALVSNCTDGIRKFSLVGF